jgi:hypothetical protein
VLPARLFALAGPLQRKVDVPNKYIIEVKNSDGDETEAVVEAATDLFQLSGTWHLIDNICCLGLDCCYCSPQLLQTKSYAGAVRGQIWAYNTRAADNCTHANVLPLMCPFLAGKMTHNHHESAQCNTNKLEYAAGGAQTPCSASSCTNISQNYRKYCCPAKQGANGHHKHNTTNKIG